MSDGKNTVERETVRKRDRKIDINIKKDYTQIDIKTICIQLIKL